MGGGASRRGLRVVVIGGGVGGLCLAQGLRQAGVHVEVYERDESVRGRNQGYRLHISPEGEQALRDCLPRPVRELLVATANSRYGYGMAVYDEHLVEQWGPEINDPRADRPEKVDAVDRVTLRRVLLAGLHDVVRFGRRFTHYERPVGGGVVAHFADGDAVRADVLVAADGSNSVVRRQQGDLGEPRDLGVRTVFGRIPMTGALRRGVPEVLQDRFTWVIGSDGHKLGLMPMVYRVKPRQAAAKLWPGYEFDDTGDYFMSVFSMHRSATGMADREFLTMSGARLWELVVERTSGWHPALRTILRYADVSETFPVAVRATAPIEPWAPGNVIPLGDAVHAMPPSGGVGANTAMRDASTLTRWLRAVDRGECSVSEASENYQAEMLGYATEAVAMSLRVAKWSLKRIDFDESVLATA
ncbi:NAD(P)/FAD-dependent oxidoreductase [Kibdelosporangium persicum]|uniref:FAD-dependent urate hydroxylase n=1 Tax=Kibdelosporangium persicum TaxID=2698649 RepID=A0ABX2FI03_9PSEU|nr:FAD-dependent monooxygenase [Kibdelosporangium persicum]NRN71016.1 FAD-dependent urate hydroxylase [Kibdelosporangium persicum]